MKNPVMALPLSAVMRAEIALPLQHVMNIHTVGCFLKAWRSPRIQRRIEEFFDSPEQARHAASTCAAWLGIRTPAEYKYNFVGGWWKDESPGVGVGQA